MFKWNYRMIKVAVEDGEDIGLLVEVIYNEQGEIEGFCKADLMSIADFDTAYADVQTQKGKLLNFFYDNGTFTQDQRWVSKTPEEG